MARAFLSHSLGVIMQNGESRTFVLLFELKLPVELFSIFQYAKMTLQLVFPATKPESSEPENAAF